MKFEFYRPVLFADFDILAGFNLVLFCQREVSR
jgi:hypothetical protein